jgi:gamma-glutamyltranspeptidase
MTEIAFNVELLIFQFVVGDDEVSIHRNSIDTGKMRRSSLDPTFLLA